MLRFSLIGIPVGVHFSFLFVAFLAVGIYDAPALVAFTLAIFLGVLVHEAGHALTARSFGAQNVSITLFALGGVTVYSSDPPLSPARRLLISTAGSAAGIAAGLPLFLLWRADAFQGLSHLARVGIWSFIIAALFWGVLNWIPIRPLDGGQMLAAGLEIVAPRHAESISKTVTLVVGAAAMIVAIAYDAYIAALFVAFLVFMGTRGSSASRRPVSPPTGSEAARPDERRPLEEEPEDFPI